MRRYKDRLYGKVASYIRENSAIMEFSKLIEYGFVIMFPIIVPTLPDKDYVENLFIYLTLFICYSVWCGYLVKVYSFGDITENKETRA